jgi:hypothetical protein
MTADTDATALPAPLVADFVDLTDFGFMPLQVKRLRDSDLAALHTPEECWAALLLWAASWHQVPAASLPDDDRVLAHLAGYGRVVREWQRVRAGALYRFVLCSDGRLYHPVVAELAIDAWESKLRRMHATECARIRKYNDRNAVKLAAPTLQEFTLGRLWITANKRSSGSGCHAPPGAMSNGTKAHVPWDTTPETVRQGIQGTGTGISTLPTLSPDKDRLDAGQAAPKGATAAAVTLPSGIRSALAAVTGALR